MIRKGNKNPKGVGPFDKGGGKHRVLLPLRFSGLCKACTGAACQDFGKVVALGSPGPKTTPTL